MTIKHQGPRGGAHAGEPLVDHGAGAVVGRREQMGVDAEGERGVGVAEVLGQLLDGDATGEHDAGVVVAQLVDAFLPGGDIPGTPAAVFLRFRDDNRVLAIQRRDDGRWVPPGGVLELKESPESAVAREVLEETGMEVQAERLTGVYKNMNLGVVTLAFRCKLIGGNEHPTSEATRVAWLTVAEAQRDMPEPRAVRVTDALDDNGPFVRIHDGTKLIELDDHGSR